jgi:hypothetical protein
LIASLRDSMACRHPAGGSRDTDLQQCLRDHPGLGWKALNVRKHRGLDEMGGEDEG